MNFDPVHIADTYIDSAIALLLHVAQLCIDLFKVAPIEFGLLALVIVVGAIVRGGRHE